MRTGPAFGTIAWQETWRAFNNFWSRLAVIMALAYTIVFLGRQFTGGAAGHTVQAYVDFLSTLRWGALAIAATMGGPSLLEDHRRGALELYYSRAVTRGDYLTGKVLAVFGLATFVVFLPALLYYGGSFFFFDKQPDRWAGVIGGALLYSLMWGLLVAGLGLGLSSIARSSRGATLLLLGGFVGLEIFMSQLLSGLTRNPNLQILSPFAALKQQTSWIFQIAEPYSFPAWWGLVEWGALVILGWGLLAWKHPRVRGEERVGP